jgi:sn-glycerol 3-phosphate transport system permease protein
MSSEQAASSNLPGTVATPAPTPRLKRMSGYFSGPRRKELGLALLYSAPALVIFTLFTYIPFFRAIYLSLHVTNNLGEPARFNGLDYYIRILGLDGRTDGLESIALSFQFALMVVPLGIVLSLGLALLATVKVRFIGIFRTIFTMSIAISLASAAVIWALIYNPSTGATTWLVNLLGINSPTLLNDDRTAMAAVAATTIWSGLGFNFIITLAGIQAIPTDYAESAQIDGANRWQIFRFITLPLLSPTLLFLLIINTIGSLQAFTQFHLLIPQQEPNVFVYETYLSFWYDNRYGFASAMSIVLFFILLILTAIQYRVTNRGVHYQ